MKPTRSLLLLLTAALIPVVILAAVSGRYFIQEQQRALDEKVRAEAADLASSLQRELDSQIKLLTILAESPRLDPPISRKAFAEIARRMKEQIPEWEQVRISDQEGNIILSVPAADAQQRVVDISSHERVVRDGVPTVGAIAIGPRGFAGFAIRVPIVRNARVTAVLSSVMRPAVVTDLLFASGLPTSWSAWVVDRNDRLVTSTGAPTLAGGEARAFASFSGRGFGTAELHGGAELRVAEVALQSVPWLVRVGLPVSEHQALSSKATLLLLAASAVALLLSGTAVVLFLRESRTRNQERESLANWQRMDALGKLTGQAAHDFNNLLMVFQAGVDGISRRRHDEQRVTQLLSHMAGGVTRGKEITQRLLSFSRRSNQGAERVDVNIWLAEVLPLLRQAANDSIVIALDASLETWPVHADPVALEIALIHLVKNATEAMPKGGEITVSARNVSDGKTTVVGRTGEFVAITVADTGAGVALGSLNRVFEPFFSTKQGAAGLGLTQVHSFASANGGSVEAASLPGQGSAFTIYLPRSREEWGQERGSATVGNELPRSILIVDDTAASLESARLSLEMHIPKIITASGGAVALKLLREHPDIDAVLTDVMMPNMSGVDLAKEIAMSSPPLPVVLMTGYSEKLEEGADLGRPIVAKPFKVEELARAFADAKSFTEPDNVIRLRGAVERE